MGYKRPENNLSPFEKGIDFAVHFSLQSFTVHDIKERYGCTLRQAYRIFTYASIHLPIVCDGTIERFYPGKKRVFVPKWKIGQ